MQETWPCSEGAVPFGSIPFTRAGGGVGKQRQGERLKAVGSPETCCWGCEHCLAEVCLLTTFPFHSRRFFFSFFKVLATGTGAMKVNTLHLLLLFFLPPSRAWTGASSG